MESEFGNQVQTLDQFKRGGPLRLCPTLALVNHPPVCRLGSTLQVLIPIPIDPLARICTSRFPGKS